MTPAQRRAAGLLLWALFLVFAGSGLQRALAAPGGADSCELPRYANWNSGQLPGGYGPAYQLKLLREGHRVAPWFYLPPPHENFPLKYYEEAIGVYRKANLPITFVSTQWERFLTEESRYRSLSDDSNPNVILANGKTEAMLSPFGDEKYWYEVGLRWTSRPLMANLQKLYPDPPAVIFLSNNEHPKLPWTELTNDRRYAQRYGKSTLSYDARRQLAADSWTKLYKALQRGMRDGLQNPNWKAKARFIGYLSHGNPQFGIGPRWNFDQTFYSAGTVDSNARHWDGASYSYYLYNRPYPDPTVVRSPQIEAMNWIFMIDENKQLNPDYYYELSLWDGSTNDKSSKRVAMENSRRGSSLSTYIGMAKFGTWLMRPSVVREFRFYDEKAENHVPYADGIVNFVDKIAANPLLHKFWCQGRLVANQSRRHPYDSNIPAQYRDKDRWFLLNTSEDEIGHWSLSTKIPVFSLALAVGARPSREWLVYLYASDDTNKQVDIEIPEYSTVRLQATPGGAYYHIQESGNVIAPVD